MFFQTSTLIGDLKDRDLGQNEGDIMQHRWLTSFLKFVMKQNDSNGSSQL